MGVFTNSGQALDPSNSQSVALGDLDGDGDLDAMVANSNQPNTVWINQPLTTATLTVCEDGGCDFTNIQDAINAAGAAFWLSRLAAEGGEAALVGDAGTIRVEGGAAPASTMRVEPRRKASQRARARQPQTQ